MARQDMADAAAAAQRRVEGADRGTRQAERDGYALAFKHQHRRLDRLIRRIAASPLLLVEKSLGSCGR
nr:hypothetical protein [uncultured Lichenicoccus sp.]